jgi:bifunctional DNA-binding transcriptional regulator/antitoxin component of YhaV-PrlF toxin-antitoxin module
MLKKIIVGLLRMRFNKSYEGLWNSIDKNQNASEETGSLYVLDTVTVDSQCRFTITKKIRDFLPVQPRDIMAVFRDSGSDVLVLKLQRAGSVIKTWEIKKVPRIDRGSHAGRPFASETV